VARLSRVYGEQAEYLDLYVEQLRRWGAGPLTYDQRRAVERLIRGTATLRELNTSVRSRGR
jgi:hypothetical protein